MFQFHNVITELVNAALSQYFVVSHQIFITLVENHTAASLCERYVMSVSV